MRSVSSRIWTRIAVSISYDDNHYTTGTSIGLYQMLPLEVKGDLGVMAMKGYTTFPEAPRLEPHFQIL